VGPPPAGRLAAAPAAGPAPARGLTDGLSVPVVSAAPTLASANPNMSGTSRTAEPWSRHGSRPARPCAADAGAPRHRPGLGPPVCPGRCRPTGPGHLRGRLRGPVRRRAVRPGSVRDARLRLRVRGALAVTAPPAPA